MTAAIAGRALMPVRRRAVISAAATITTTTSLKATIPLPCTMTGTILTRRSSPTHLQPSRPAAAAAVDGGLRRWYSTEWAEPAPSHPTVRKWTFNDVIRYLGYREDLDKRRKAGLVPIDVAVDAYENHEMPQETWLVDVREKNELVKTGKIPGALNIPMSRAVEGRGCWRISAEAFREAYGFDRPAKGSHVVFYCRAGVRAHAAAAIVAEAGWKSIGEYSGSWLEWIKEGGPCERVFSNVKDSTSKRWRPLIRRADAGEEFEMRSEEEMAELDGFKDAADEMGEKLRMEVRGSDVEGKGSETEMKSSETEDEDKKMKTKREEMEIEELEDDVKDSESRQKGG
ncbi:hypothetical protein CP532_7032 [Ophiocordyceps camponoti-leonardi (nom. inval.)]|nr:hypothetical protein CP532_7032 [Ophiocordyceps camponoti-leonardi (nom. inval.)]